MIQSFVKRVAPLAALAMSVGLAGCGDFSVTINGEEGVPLSELDMSGATPDELVVSGPDKVIVTAGDELSISVEGDDDAVDKVRFVLDGDLLGVTREEGTWSDNGTAVVRVTMPAPREIVIGGSGSAEANTMADEASIVIGGSGSVSVGEINAKSLEVAIGGSGSVTASGTTEQLEMSIGGNGSGRFSNLKADDVEITIGGSGSVDLQSDGSVEANIAGSGSINVTGSATCDVNAFGSGTLKCTPSSDGDNEATEEEGTGEEES